VVDGRRFPAALQLRTVHRWDQVEHWGDVAFQDVEPWVAPGVVDAVQRERFGVAPGELQLGGGNVEGGLSAERGGLDLDVPLVPGGVKRQDVIAEAVAVVPGGPLDAASQVGAAALAQLLYLELDDQLLAEPTST
jgi:hypothetical protein